MFLFQFIFERQFCWKYNSWFIDFFLLAVWIYHPTDFWPPLFLMRSQLLILLWFPCLWWVVFLCYFKNFPLFLPFGILTMMFPSVNHLGPILLEFCWNSWVCRWMISLNLEFSVNFLNIFSYSYIFLSLSDTLILCMCVSVLNGVPQFFEALFNFFHSFLSFLNCTTSIDLSSSYWFFFFLQALSNEFFILIIHFNSRITI